MAGSAEPSVQLSAGLWGGIVFPAPLSFYAVCVNGHAGW